MSWTATHLVEAAPAKEGIGVRATQPLEPGTVIGVFAGPVQRFPMRAGRIDYDGANTALMLDVYRDRHDGALFAIALDDPGELVNRVNHSCRPNCKLDGVHSLTLVTARRVEAGEELTFDYRPLTLDPLGVRCWCDGKAEDERCLL